MDLHGSPLPRATIIRPEDLAIDTSSPLGNRSGSVFPAKWDNQVVAVKVLSLPSEVSPELFISRVGLWQSLSHPHLLKVFGASPPDADTTFIITPCYQSGNVRQYLTKYPNVERPQLILEVALGMQFLHKRGLVHGSLRPSNILVNDNGKACVSDHGMVDLHTPSNAEAHRYFSPEAWKGIVSAPSDVYAFAMSALEIFTSSPPWGVLSEKHIYQLVVHEDTRPDHPDPDLSIRVGLLTQFWSIIEESWHKESRLRPSFDIIVRLWQAASNDDLSDISSIADTRRAGPSTNSLYPHDPSHVHTLSQTSFASGPPAYEAEVTETTPATHVPDSTLGSSHTHRPSADTLSPSQSIRAPPRDIYGSVPHSAPISSSSRFTYEFPSPPSMLPPPRRGASVPSTPYSPQFRPSPLPTVNEIDATSIRAPQPTRAPPSTLAHQPSTRSFSDHRALTRSPPGSVSSSGSSNSNRVNYSLPPTPQSANLTFPTVITPATNTHSIPSAHGQRRLTAATLRTFQKPSDSDNHSDILSFYDDLSSALPPMSPQRHDSKNRAESILRWEANHRRYTSQTGDRILPSEDVASIRTDSGSVGESSSSGVKPNPVLLMGALQSEIKEGRDRYVIDNYLVKIQMLAIGSVKDAQRLVTAGAVPTLIHLLKIRAATMEGLEILLLTLGTLAFDSISANTIYRTNTAGTLIEIFDSATSSEIMTLVSWCLNRICRNSEIASGLIKQNLVRLLVQKGLQADHATPSISAYCLGTLAQSDGLAETLADMGVIQAVADFLRVASEVQDSRVDDVCSALYALARISRSIKLAKTISKTGCLAFVAHHLCHSEDPQVLNWSARAVGCMMRPNSSDMSKTLLDAGVAAGLARLPSVLPPEEVEPLSSFAFTIQRFSCAEWGSGTRKSLVEAGVVDSLLAALRTAAEEPYPQVHIDLALAVSFLSDVGGAPIRKEIVNAGGIDILRRVGATGSPEVSKACNMAIKSTTGNLWSRNAASAKTAMTHNWNGGCPDYQPPCPLMFSTEPNYETY